MRALARPLAALVAIGFLAATVARAETDRPIKKPRTPNLVVFGIGASYWTDVHDIDPSGSPFAEQLGRFHTWGFNLEGGFHRRVARWGSVDVFAGGDFGLFVNENSKDFDAVVIPFGNTIDAELVARGLYLTPSVRFVVAGSARWRLHLGAGAGIYSVDFAELFEDGWEVDDIFSEEDLGGYLSMGVDRSLWVKRPRWRLRLEGKVHTADFGSTDEYAPDSGTLEGPFQTFLVGFVWDY